MFMMDEYQKFTGTTAQYPGAESGSLAAITYNALGMSGESGEVLNKLKKVYRGDLTLEEFRAFAANELGDVLWYVARMAKELNLSLDDIVQMNVAKLNDRKARGVIKGSGDAR